MPSMNFELGFGRSGGAVRNREAERLTVIVLGNFSGENAAVQPELARRPLIAVDVDNFDAVMARLQPSLALPLELAGPSEAERIAFAGLDDFHPDTLYRRLEPIRALRELRRQLADPATFEQAARLLESAPEPPPESRAAPAEAVSGNLFEQLIGKPPAAPEPAPAAGHSLAEGLIAHLIRPHLARTVNTERQTLLMAALDDAIGETLRRVLHAPAFQTLEAAWRGLHGLVNQLAAEETVRIFLLNATVPELLADWTGADRIIEHTALGSRCIDRDELGLEGAGRCLWVGNFDFGATAEHMELLSCLGSLAAATGGIFLGGGEAGLLGLSDPEQLDNPAVFRNLPDSPGLWSGFRTTPPARRVGLSLPRYILRLPYGSKTDPVESFHFEEIPGNPHRTDYLWGNPAFLWAGLLIGAYSTGGGDALYELPEEVGDLPCHVYPSDTGRAMQPATEYLLSDHAAESLLKRGLLPLRGSSRHNGIRLGRLQSVADPRNDLTALL